MMYDESQTEARAKLDAKLTEKAYAELASSILPPEEQIVYHTDNLELFDSAVAQCLRHSHVEAGTVPDKVQDPEERTDYLCRPSGFMHRSVRLREGWYRESFGAMVGQLKDGTPVALLPRKIYGYDSVEPGSGKKIPVNRDTAAQLHEKAIRFYPPLPSHALSVRDLAFYIIGSFSHGEYLIVFAAALAAALIGLLPAWVHQIAYGIVVPSGQVNLILPITVLLLGVTISKLFIDTSRSLVINRFSTKLQIHTEAAVYARVLMLPPAFFRNYSAGNLSNRIMQTSQLIREIMSLALGAGLTTLMSFIYLGQIFYYAQALTRAAFLFIFLQVAFIAVAIRITGRYEKDTMNASAKLSGTVTTLLRGISKIKLSGAENRAFAKWAHDYAAYARAAYNRPNFVRAIPACISVIGLLGTVVIYYLAGKAQLSVADFMTFSMAYGMMTSAVMTLSGLMAQAVKIAPMIEMSKPIFEAVPEISREKPMVTELNGGVEMNNVSFRYDDDSPWVLENLSLKIRPGEYVAFVGRSGCGKSTIVRLLLGFEKPVIGSIFYSPGTYDVTNVDLYSLRRHIGTVMQDSRLLTGDILGNIILSSPSSTEEDAWRAAELAGIAEDIRKMPMGMHTIISEGSGGISGGQRQRLMIARAICGRRKILILDEATSALDNITQKHVADSLAALKSTRIVVAHRLSTVQDCDRIFVVDGGKITASGTYEELIQQNGLFAELVSRQQLGNES